MLLTVTVKAYQDGREVTVEVDRYVADEGPVKAAGLAFDSALDLVSFDRLVGDEA